MDALSLRSDVTSSIKIVSWTRVRSSRARVCKEQSETGTTPESWNVFPKVNTTCKAVVSKSQYRSHKRSENDPPLSALWRGTVSNQAVSNQGRGGDGGAAIKLIFFSLTTEYFLVLKKN